MNFDKIDKKITKILDKVGLPFLRYSLALIFIWFGILKPLGISPAAELASNTVYWLNPSWFVPFLGWWEVLIGVCLLYKPLIRIGIFLLTIQMVGTFLPIFILPKIIFGTPFYSLTLEGQYILKNLILIGAGMVIGSNVRDKTKY
jgi:uncharacterized membrane protein YkgB